MFLCHVFEVRPRNPDLASWHRVPIHQPIQWGSGEIEKERERERKREIEAWQTLFQSEFGVFGLQTAKVSLPQMKLEGILTERQRDRETERQGDRETERQRDRETERQVDRETERQRD